MVTKPTPISNPAETVLPVMTEYIGVKPGYCGGKPHLLGHRIKVQHIAIWHERMGMSPEEIIANHEGLSLSAVYAALAYYHAHRAEIDADIAADEQFIAEMKAKSGPVPLRQTPAQSHAPDASLPPG
jgi:uncharacterized protein (DUF433 family)